MGVTEGLWPTVSSNAGLVRRELSLEEEFALAADDTLAWSEEMLAIAAEMWTEE